MISLSYTTITIPLKVKRKLEEEKGNKDWGRFLLELLNDRREKEKLERKIAALMLIEKFSKLNVNFEEIKLKMSVKEIEVND